MPVMGHVGLTPQSATMLGGFKAQGRTAEKAERLYEDALALEAAGCFAIVLEAVPAAVAARVTEALHVPTIGIGAGAGCDGQVLVWHDLLGLYEGKAPRFVKRYADLAAEAKRALEAYVDDVREGRFPEEQHTYAIPDEELDAFEAWLATASARARSARARAALTPRRRSAELDHDERRVAGAMVGAAPLEHVLAVDGEPHGPDDEQRERDRRRGEREHVPRLPEGRSRRRRA